MYAFLKQDNNNSKTMHIIFTDERYTEFCKIQQIQNT